MAVQKMAGEARARRRRIFFFHRGLDFQLRTSRIYHQTTGAVVQEKWDAQSLAFRGCFTLFSGAAARDRTVEEAVRFRKRRDQSVGANYRTAYFHGSERCGADRGCGDVLNQTLALQQREAAKEEQDADYNASHSPEQGRPERGEWICRGAGRRVNDRGDDFAGDLQAMISVR